MRIALISTPFLSVPPKTYGGTELIVHELVTGLRDAGHEVFLYATGDSEATAELRSLYPIPQWPPEPLADINHVSWAFQHAVQEEVDLIHAHSAMALAFGRHYPHVPLVYTLHHVRDEALSAFYRYFHGPTYIAISKDQAQREVRLPNLKVIHHGLDPSPYRCRAEPDDYVCFVGRLSAVKGPHTAIDVAERAGLPIRVAGEIHSVDMEYGEREVRPRLTRPHVSYLGCVAMDVKVPLLERARALLAPIEWNEPFGLILIEAMLSGCPVVAYPGGSVPELVEEGVTGFVVRSPEEMARTIGRDGPVEGFDRERCRSRAIERFGRDRMVQQHLDLYREILAGRAAAGRDPARRPMHVV